MVIMGTNQIYILKIVEWT